MWHRKTSMFKVSTLFKFEHHFLIETDFSIPFTLKLSSFNRLVCQLVGQRCRILGHKKNDKETDLIYWVLDGKFSRLSNNEVRLIENLKFGSTSRPILFINWFVLFQTVL